MFVRKPLSSERWPVESCAQYHIVEKGRILLPGLILFIDDLLFILRVFYTKLFTYYTLSAKRQQILDLEPTIVVLIHVDKGLLILLSDGWFVLLMACDGLRLAEDNVVQARA